MIANNNDYYFETDTGISIAEKDYFGKDTSEVELSKVRSNRSQLRNVYISFIKEGSNFHTLLPLYIGVRVCWKSALGSLYSFLPFENRLMVEIDKCT